MARRRSRGLIWCVALFSAVANLLLLTGPIYMLQVYDRVLSSRSVETLVVLSILAVFLFSILAVLDFVRARLMVRVALRMQSHLQARVFDAGLRHAMAGSARDALPQALCNLGTVQRVMAAPVTIAFVDLPWVPLFLLCIFVFHSWLGWLAFGGVAALLALAVLNQTCSRDAAPKAARSAAMATGMADDLGAASETVGALGMRHTAYHHWSGRQAERLRLETGIGDISGGFSAASRALRLILQSAILGLGAYLVLRGALSPGAMIATSVLTVRALAPIEQIIGGWPLVRRATNAWQALSTLLETYPAISPRAALPKPEARLHVRHLSVAPPETRMPALRGVGFEVAPGQAVGVIGASGAGKTALARAIVGSWRPFSGQVRLGNTPIEAFGAGQMGSHVGYLPQRVELFTGTVAENIARTDPDATVDAVTAAARRAGAHEMILALSEGYDTPLCPRGGQLSGGQVQRIALARAVYGDPVLLILDEPNSNLDNAGVAAINTAIRQFKQAQKAVLVMAHRPAAIQECDHLLWLEDGILKQFGTRDEVLRSAVRNHAQLLDGGHQRHIADGAGP
ncbi:type I secretion system permease/ATPase [Roseovarius pelagicus]|uniref:Type I secretion system permease/ATPase n=1 Tax=Roseovarius pelagicus TaxID=2980108 RepID=A0ABY6DF82_9RHOB|nr:type I secretion system permease/ATPase [Roseovarius pelagicus]UXX84817.1 type I secretion system permease/ATPase [Roseovarius pelagicus]